VKRVLLKNRNNEKKGIKALGISSHYEDKHTMTLVRKKYIYHFLRVQDQHYKKDDPQIRIKKTLNSKKRIKDFTFRVRGHFFVRHEGVLLEVKYRHYLNMQTIWKTKSQFQKEIQVTV